MKRTLSKARPSVLALVTLAASLASLAGCDQSSQAYFTATSAPKAEIQRSIDRLDASLATAKDEQKEDIRTSIKNLEEELGALPEKQRIVTTIVDAMFGTPDKPIVLSATGLDANKIRLAAGPTTANQDGNTGGLYRRHCVHCHGVAGNGAGPTAEFLNPYPRDFRHGWFKFKSTGINEKPTDDDLRRILREGINGTAMPSFKLLPAAEIDALVEYVKYLSIRGEVENTLYKRFDDDGIKEMLAGAMKGGEAGDEFRALIIEDLLSDEATGVMATWKRANERIVEVVPRPEVSSEESIQKGREIFYGKGGCVQCHGDSAMGDGQTYYVNDIDATRSNAIKQLVNPSFPMQALKPRNLRYTVIRGPSRDIDLYRRLRNGIDAVGMPAPTIPPEEVWHLVDYVKSLPYEFNEPGPTQSENTRAN
ncbi:MAG: hypothetical protein DCC68_02205 [Planctomycetota bacterium]|nr:MAG: hypothetical protein DCC68_02205 [Planctomycetota bacterium]